MRFRIQKKTYVIIAVLLFVAAISIAATKPEESEQSIDAFAVDYEMPDFNQKV